MEHASSESFDNAKALASRDSACLLLLISSPNTTNATFCRAVKSSPQVFMP